MVWEGLLGSHSSGGGSGMKAHQQDQTKEKTLNHIKVITRK